MRKERCVGRQAQEANHEHDSNCIGLDNTLTVFKSYIGDAIHTLQDSTSPEHSSSTGQPLPWNGSGPGYILDILHFLGEADPGVDWARIGQAIRLTLAVPLEVGAKMNGLTISNYETAAQAALQQYRDVYYSQIPVSAVTNNAVERDAARQCSNGNPAACDQ